jgi:hypothetical protein
MASSWVADPLAAFIVLAPKVELEAINGSINGSESNQSHLPTAKVILIDVELSSDINTNTCSAVVSTGMII